MTTVITVVSKGVDDTRSVGAAVAALTRPSDVVLLSGDLGTGKTAFTQGLAAGLGVAAQVTSPTFTLARSYEGRLRLHHLDVYRLDRLQEAVDLGLAELMDDGGVTLVEWGDVIIPTLAADFLEIRLAYGEADEERTILFRCVGPRWSNRAVALALAMLPWNTDEDLPQC